MISKNETNKFEKEDRKKNCKKQLALQANQLYSKAYNKIANDFKYKILIFAM